MEAVDALDAATPRIVVESVDVSEEEYGSDDNINLYPDENSLIVVPLDVDRRSSSASPRDRERGKSIVQMGREAGPFFSTLLMFSVAVAVLATFTVGLGAKVQVQLVNSHTEWAASLWSGGIAVLVVGLLYLFVHVTIKQGWMVARYAFISYQVLLVIVVAVTVASLARSFATYKSVKAVPTDQCTYINFEGTYFPVTQCYERCRTFLYNTTGHSNLALVCCCCDDYQENEVIYFTGVPDCSKVDASESELRYLTVCYIVLLVMQVIMFSVGLVVLCSCCGVVAPWRYMILSATHRYSVN